MQYNIAFQRPLKNQCDICFGKINMQDKENELSCPEYDRHMKNKDLARAQKDADKALAGSDTSRVTACSDLQQVFTLPKSFQGHLYYSIKIE